MPESPSPAIAAFIRGVGPRARLLAKVQSGAAMPAEQALSVVARVFASEAGQWPLAQWPQQYWRLLLATPLLRHPGPSEPGLPLHGIARLPAIPRAALLLQLVAELDDATGAMVLGLSMATYQDAIRDGLPRDALGQPDLDVWRAWRAAAQRELAKIERAPAAVARQPRENPAAFPTDGSTSGDAGDEADAHRHVRWLWLGMAVCVMAFATTFFLHPAGREVLQRWTATIKVEALAAASEPKARFDPGDIALHPDRGLLEAPEEAAHANQLALLSWLLVNSADPRSADALHLPVVLAPPPRIPTHPTRAADQLAARLRQWDALPPHARGLRRGHWQAWRALNADERVRLRVMHLRWGKLAPQEQQGLRERFLAQPSDARLGWWLGPALGQDWPRIQSMFSYVDPGERDGLLQLLRQTDSNGWDVLERLAQATPPEERAQLRSELLMQGPSQRDAWLRAQLAR
ncbi:MAG: DUF3106 domain-containing protein [Pseudomonadota bacterium]|nr:DUF3106 domain-containing protein [Pseudomonadota bacterium]MDQ3160805.1 DUF3106 domain-containing protein [Pseudomonadota bacterium]